MREAQVHTAAMDVEGIAEVLAGHRRALEVPSRAAPSEGRRPGCALQLLRLAPFPERKVARVALAPGISVLGRRHVVHALVGELTIGGPRADVEVHIAAAVLSGVR